MLMVLGPHKNRSALKSERGEHKTSAEAITGPVDGAAAEDFDRVKPTTRTKNNLAAFDTDQI
jgi:hypothetical protein